jgi:hypothetical protein
MRPVLPGLTAILLLLAATMNAGTALALRQANTPASWVARAPGSADAGALTPEETVWNDRLLAAMDGSANLANDIMTGGDVYLVGRTGGDYVEALLVAFRATGDIRYLDRVYQLSELARGSLRDAWTDGTTDGYTSWLWLQDPANATFYGKDTNWLDESISSGNVALWAWALHSNRGLDARYGVAADFWRNWLENNFLAKWYARAGGNPLTAWNTPYAAFYKPDTEPRSANWRLAHYLWKLTGNTFYRDREQSIVSELSGANEINPARPLAFRWTKETDPASVNWQPVNYANYYMRVVLEMNLEGMPFYSSDWNMKRFAGAFRDVVYAGSMPTRTAMTNTVNGDGSTGFALYAFNGFSTWDSTGFLMNLANASITGAANYASGGQSKAARNDVYISAYALLALSPAGPTAALVTSFQAVPLDDGTVRVSWSLSGAGEQTVTNLYRVSADGVERTLVNSDPFVGPGPQAIVDTAPGSGPTVTYRLVETASGADRTLQQYTVDLGTTGAGPGGQAGVRLAPASPNPFETSTLISFELPSAQPVRVAIYDSAGRLVRELEAGRLPAGRYSRSWDGRDTQGRVAPSGLYFCVVETPGERLMRRAVRVK